MQQKTPQQGRLFPDNPQMQQGPRFASNAPAQGYEPQLRMQQTGSLPVVNAPAATAPLFTTGSIQVLRGTQPVQTMQPMATMPPASAFQSQQNMPVMIQTLQGTPVLVTREALEAAYAALPKAPADPADPAPAGKGRKKKDRKKAKADPQADPGKKPRRKRFSLIWFLFGLIGLGFTLVSLARYIVIPLLSHYL